MNPPPNELEPDAEMLCENARKYAFIAASALENRSTNEQDESFDDRVEELQVHYLFPNLTESERHLVLGLKYARRGLWIRLMTKRKVPGSISERDLTQNEYFYMQVKEIANELMPKLSPLQRQILASREYSIHWPDDD